MTVRPNVLFITDNGHGLGHLTRMMAVAKRAGDRFRPVFLTMSQAFPIVRQFGWPVEYLPSYKRLRMSKGEWEPMLASRLVGLLTHIEPRAVVVDHIFPARVLASVSAGTEGIDFIWSRRGMWREGRNELAIHSSDYFDLIVEPQDIAGPIDVGATTEYHRNVAIVAPVLFVGADELIERDAARHALGIPNAGTAILLNLSDSDEARLAGLIGQVRDVVRSFSEQNVYLFAPFHVLHRTAIPHVEGVIMKPVYPVAAYLRAFDGIIATAGYNSFHEAVGSGLPAVFVARDTDALDDQARRAEFAELTGRGYFAPSVDDPSFLTAVEHMLASGEGEIAALVAREFGEFDGAAQFADVIAERCEARSDQPVAVNDDVGRTGPGLEVLERVSAVLTDPGGPPPERVVVLALGLDQADLARAASQLASMQQDTRQFMPVFLVDDVDQEPLDEHGFLYETIVTRSEYEEVGLGEYTQFVHSCLEGLRSRYRPARVVASTPDGTLRPGLLLGEEDQA